MDGRRAAGLAAPWSTRLVIADRWPARGAQCARESYPRNFQAFLQGAG
jgi:hypothetical protein